MAVRSVARFVRLIRLTVGSAVSAQFRHPMAQALFLRGYRPHIPSASGDTAAMSEPLVVVIPHRLGKDEALRRIKEGLGRAKTEFAWLLSLEEEIWSGDRLAFRASALGQRASGILDVYETGVRLEVTLPWLLARFAHAAQRVIGQKGQLMLEKK